MAIIKYEYRTVTAKYYTANDLLYNADSDLIRYLRDDWEIVDKTTVSYCNNAGVIVNYILRRKAWTD